MLSLDVLPQKIYPTGRGSNQNVCLPQTNFLVVGEQDCSLVGDDGMSTKEERAYQLINECGVDIKIIDEATFLKLICCKEGAASGTA